MGGDSGFSGVESEADSASISMMTKEKRNDEQRCFASVQRASRNELGARRKQGQQLLSAVVQKEWHDGGACLSEPLLSRVLRDLWLRQSRSGNNTLRAKAKILLMDPLEDNHAFSLTILY